MFASDAGREDAGPGNRETQEFGMAQPELVHFPSHGGHQLAARFDAPLGIRRGLAIFAHCFTCSKDLKAARRISEGLAAHGIGVLRFDFTGLGHSEGEFGNAGFRSNVRDLVAAAQWLTENHGAPDILVGHSLGGAAVLAAAAQLPDVHGVVTIGAPADPAHVTHLLGDKTGEIESKGSAEVSISGRSFEISKSFLDDLDGLMQREVIANLRKDILVLHSPIDDIVGVENATAIFTAARHPKSFVSLDKADHLLSRAADAGFAADVIAGWASRHVGEGERPDVPEGKVLVEPLGEDLFPHLVAAGGHIAYADEPRTVGGLDTGFTPYDLLLGGLGACTAMTIRMYARRKNWPLEDVRVTLKHEKRHAEDCDSCEEKGPKLDFIEREIRFSGDLTREQQERLLEIADKCPVHRTLESDIRILTRAILPGGGVNPPM